VTLTPPGVLLSFGAAIFCWLAGVYHADFIGGVSMLFLGIVLSRFFGDGGYAVVGPYAAEMWPAGLLAPAAWGSAMPSAISARCSVRSVWR
jgi:hypothetical protein